jgi:RHS repeat-associated protein
MENGMRFGRIRSTTHVGRCSALRRPGFSLGSLGILAVLILVAVMWPSVASAAECTDTWTGPAEGGTWQTAGNWSTGKVPTSEDVACIETGKTPKVTATQKVAVVQGEGNLKIEGGTLELTRLPSEGVSSISSLSMSGGTLTGAGTLNVTSSLTIAGGNMTGTGKTVLKPGATGEQTSGTLWIKERTLINEGMLTLAGGSVEGSKSAVIENAGTYNVNAESIFRAESGASPEPKIVNTGTFRKTSGTGNLNIWMNIENKGTVETKTGGLSFTKLGSSSGSASWVSGGSLPIVLSGGSFPMSSGTSWSGNFEFAGIATVTANGGFHDPAAKLTITGGASVSVPTGSLEVATLALQGGSVSLNGSEASTVPTVSMKSETFGATVSGSGTLNITNSLSIAGGNFFGTGKTVLKSGATGEQTSGMLTITERTFFNEGTFTFANGSLEGGKSGVIENAGTYNVNTETLFRAISTATPEPKIVNTGALRKTSGTGNLNIWMNIENSGTVETKTGGLSFTKKGSSSGSASWVSGGSLPIVLSAGAFPMSSGTSWSGNFEFAGIAAVTANGGFHNPAAKLTISGGASLSVPSANLEVSTLVLQGGSVNLNGSEVSTVPTVSMKGETFNASVNGAANLNITSSLSMAGGCHFAGTGKTVLKPGATGEQSSGMLSIYERTFLNEGTFTMAPGATFEGEKAAVIENVGTYNVNSEGIFRAVSTASPEPRIVNTGIFRKTAGSGSPNIWVNIENSGTVETKTGGLGFTKKGSSSGSASWVSGGSLPIILSAGAFPMSSGTSWSGNFSVNGLATVTQAGSLLDPSGSLTVKEGSTLTSGMLELSSLVLKGGTVSLSGPGASKVGAVEMESLSFGANVSGSGDLEISKSLNVTSGNMNGTGTTVLKSGASGELTPAGGTFVLNERRFVNQGTLTLPAGLVQASKGALLENRGTFRANSETGSSQFKVGSTPAPLIANTGTFEKTSGTGTTTVDINFENQGQIQEKTGHLKITHPVSAGTREQFSKECKSGDPVNCATGDFTESQSDFSIGGSGVGLNLTRFYSSQAAATSATPGPFGYGWSNSFSDHLVSEESGKKVTLFTGSGSSVPFTGGPGTFTAPSWSQDMLSGNAEIGYTLTLPERVKYAFSGAGRLESVSDRNGNKTTLSYNGLGQLTAITDPAGRQITFAYNSEGLIESAKDPIGHLIKYAYEGKNLKTVTLPGEEAPRWQFKCDTSHRVTSITDGRGGKTTNEYDTSNRVISQTDPAGHTLTFQYEAFHTKITNKATGSITDEWFTSNHEPFSITRGYGTADATIETFSYDAGGRLLSRTDGNGHTTTYDYNAQGDRTSEKDADGNEAKWVYNAAHEVISTTTPEGETTTIERDADGNPERISRPAPEEATQTSTFSYDEHGQLESITDSLERTWTFAYDANGDRISEADPEGDRQSVEYDGDSRPIAIVSPRGNAEGAEASEYMTTIERDALGRPLKITDPFGNPTEVTYDPNGNLETMTNANGHTIKYTYNADNQRTKVEKPNGATLETTFDGAGNVTSQTDALEQTTIYSRNVLGQLAEVVDPLGNKTLDEYDAAGNLVTVRDPKERKTTYSYDPANRLIEASYSDGVTPAVQFGYNGDGNVTSMVDGTGETTFGYDQLGRLTETQNGHGDMVAYGYDLADELTGILYPNGKAVSRKFDNASRLERITDWLGGTTIFSYDADSNVNGISFPAGTGNVDKYAYDRNDLMSESKFTKEAEPLASLTYGRGKSGEVEAVVSSGLPGPEELAYGYDENGRLIEAGEASFEYDPANNLTKAPGTTNAYDAANELESGTGVNYSYDKLGERVEAVPTGAPATSYGYDQAGNLISIERPEEGEVPAISESLAYNGSGLLASRTVGLATRYLTWGMSSSLPLLLDDEENSYIYGPDGLPIEQISAEEVPAYLHHDQLGSTRMITDAGGEVAGTFSFGPYGALEGSTGSATTPLGFAGQYTDQQTGLQYLRARFYDPATAQFLTRDPITPLTRSPYGYTQDNPINRVDPSGLCGVDSVSSIVESINPVSEENCAYQGAEELKNATNGAVDIPGTLTQPEVVDAGAVGICLAPVSDLVCGAAIGFAFSDASAALLKEGMENEFCDLSHLLAQEGINAILAAFGGLGLKTAGMSAGAPPLAQVIIRGGSALIQGALDAVRGASGG